jgi:hypothetical protein
MLAVLGDSWAELFEEDDILNYIDPGPIGPPSQLAITRHNELKIETLKINHERGFLPIPFSL